jgi:preprotein translocase subunit SecD
MWGRIATVLVALTAGAVICWLGWPPRLGIDLKGGLILVYEVDNSKQTAARVDDTVRRIEGMAATQDGAQGSVRRRAGGGVTVRLATPDERAREAFLATLTGAEFDRVAVREAGRRGSADVLEIDYDVVPESAPVAMDKLVAAVSRRVNPGGQKEVTVRQYGLDQIEVIIPEIEQSEVDLIKRIVSSAGVLEFRILANRDDARHQAAITVAKQTAGSTVRQKEEVLARWVQIDPQKMDPSDDARLVTPELTGALLPGVTRDSLLTVAADLGLSHRAAIQIEDELRLLAHMSGDPALLDMLADGAADPFVALAGVWLGTASQVACNTVVGASSLGRWVAAARRRAAMYRSN